MKTEDDIVPSLNLPVRDKVKDNTIRQIVCGGWHSFILKESGELFAFGRNRQGQLGLGDNKNRNIPTLLMIDKTTTNYLWRRAYIYSKAIGGTICFWS